VIRRKLAALKKCRMLALVRVLQHPLVDGGEHFAGHRTRWQFSLIPINRVKVRRITLQNNFVATELAVCNFNYNIWIDDI